MSRGVTPFKRFNYDETIRKLLEEGRRLGSIETESDVKIDKKSVGTLQFTDDVSRLRKEIEDQNKKTTELQNEIKQATESFRTSIPKSVPRFPLSNMNTNNNNNFFPPAPGAFGDYGNRVPPRTNASKEYLEKALEDSQTQVNYLAKKLEESQETSDKQKVHFRTAVEELQMKLQETIAGRKHLVQLREKEMEEQEEMIHKLQVTLQELATANQMQEQSILDANDRMQILEKRNQTNDKVLDRIKTIFASHEKIKGKTNRVTDSGRLSDISPEFLAESVERSMNEIYEEIEAMRNKIMELENDTCDIKQNHDREVDMLSAKQQDVLEQIKIEMNERVLEEKLNTDNSMKQIYTLQDEIQQQRYVLSSKDQEVKDIEKELTVITTQFEELKGHYFDDKESLQTKLLDVESELTTMKQSNETFKHECERLKQQLSDSQGNFLRTNEELKSERDQRRNLWIKESETSKDLSDLRQQLENKTAEIAALKEKNSDLRADLSTQVVEKVREAELVERSKADLKISELNAEVTKLREDLSRTKATLESSERQISDVMVERSDRMKTVQDKDLQLERISNQCNIAERKLAETNEARRNLEEKWEKLYNEYNEISQKLSKSQNEHDRIKSLLDEKEKLVMSLQLRVENMSSESQKTNREIEDAKVERSKLKIELKEKSKQLDEIQRELKLSEKTISDYENRIGELIQTKTKSDSAARNFENENFEFKRNLEKLEQELVDARTQISSLLDEKDEMKKVLVEGENHSKKENEKLRKQLKHAKRNLHEAENALKTIKSVDGRAAKIAENMQKEVTDKRSVIDSLQSELSKAYDKLSFIERENKNLKIEVEDATEKFDEREKNRQKNENDLRQLRKSEKGYKLAVERLEKGLEKAAVRNSTAQATITQQEKDIAQLHIQHNLQMINKRGGAQIQPMEQNTLYQPNIAQPGTGVAQSMLARLIMNMTSQSPMHDVTNQTTSVQKAPPKVEVSKSENLTATVDQTPTEMYKILSDVRDHLVKLENPKPTSTKKRSSSKKKTKDSGKRIPEYDSDISDLPVVTMTSDHTSVGSLSFLQSANMGSSMKDTLSTSLLKPEEEQSRDRPPSPVSELLFLPDEKTRKYESPQKPKRVLHENTDSNSEHSSDLPGPNTAALKTAITNTAEDLCRQLQDRLEGLSKMGGKLKQQNKVTERMIKKQDEKIQKVRGGMKFR